MKKSRVEQMIEETKIIAIVRGVELEKSIQVADALYAGGIRVMELTFDQKHPETHQNTAASIRAIQEKYEGRMLVGAGTVVTTEQVDLTADAGGTFIVSPNVDEDVIRHTVERDMASLPGALTPTEVLRAYEAGASFVKLFPIGNLGIGYLRAIKAPISGVKILAVGGINAGNLAEYLSAGAVGAGIGGNLANKKWIDAGEYQKITQTAMELVKIANQFKN